LYYNTVLNKSSDWGTSPWYWYWTSALPRALLFTFPLFPLSILRIPEGIAWLWERRRQTRDSNGVSSAAQRMPGRGQSPWWQRFRAVVDPTWIPYLLPALGYVALYSFLGHKEIRFLFPVLPLVNLGVAVALSRIHAMRFYPIKERPVNSITKLMYGGAVGALLASLVASQIFVEVSRQNYPGGQALEALARHIHRRQDQITEVRVHADVASAMTGVSKFAEREAQFRLPRVAWTFSKAGYEVEHAVQGDENLSKFTHLLSEDPSVRGFRVLEVIPGHPRLDVKRLRVVTSDAIYVLENNRFASDRAK
jgi:alpha-1,6-mannosyltransferase